MPHIRILLVALVFGVTGLPVVSAAAREGCLPAGGQRVRDTWEASGDFVFAGHGYGHGTGMSQFGAQGAAKLGCDADTILETYYPRASVERAESPPHVIVGLAQAARTVTVEAVSGTIQWELCGPADDCEDLPVEQEAGTNWRVMVHDDASYEIVEAEQTQWTGGGARQLLRARLSEEDGDDQVVRLPLTGARYRWGILQLDSMADPKNLAKMVVTLDMLSVEHYLRGIAEVPTSWPAEALRAQVIAARSYAVSRVERGLRPECGCHMYPTTSDQVYRGFEQEIADQPRGHGWVEAVEATEGAVLRFKGRTVTAYYSSSHGGHSESGAFRFGLDDPVLRPVDDSRWDLASDNPLRSWAVSFSADALGRAAGVGRAKTIELLEPLGSAGRVGDPRQGYGGVRIEGTTGTVTLSGESLRRALGMRSTLFAATGPPPPPDIDLKLPPLEPGAPKSQ
ncbi:MAG: SpoIID/LytB domain-containing protein [Egibacteraceae bacterium]